MISPALGSGLQDVAAEVLAGALDRTAVFFDRGDHLPAALIGEGEGARGFLGGEGVFGASDASGRGVGVGGDDPVVVGRGGGERADVLQGLNGGGAGAEVAFDERWGLGGAGEAFQGDFKVGQVLGFGDVFEAVGGGQVLGVDFGVEVGRA